MKRPISDIAFTSVVKQAQEKRGSRRAYARMEQQGRQGPWQEVVTPELAEFIGERDSLYLGTASADGQPHVQHRGGLRVSSRYWTNAPSHLRILQGMPNTSHSEI